MKAFGHEVLGEANFKAVDEVFTAGGGGLVAKEGDEGCAGLDALKNQKIGLEMFGFFVAHA